MAPTLASEFLDRTSEREALDRLLAHAREGESAVLVIRGAPAALPGGRFSVAGRSLRPDPRLYRATPAGGIGGDRRHRPRAEHQAGLRWSARAGTARAA